MKTIFKILLFISLGFNVYFIYTYYKRLSFAKVYDATMHGKYETLKEGSSYLLHRINKEFPQLKTKKYYLVCIWNVACGPCMKEMPTLDSLADSINRNDIAYLYLTENSNALITQFLKKRHISSRNFSFMNNGNDYIMSLLKDQGVKNKSYPIQTIIDKVGNIHYFGGAFIQSYKDSVLQTAIKNLP